MLRHLLAFTALVVSAQSPPDSQPILRTSVQLVQVNVIVRDKNGPVSNLTKEDFILTEGGKARRIDLFSIESLAGEDSQPLPQNTFSNHHRRSQGRSRNVTIVLLDILNTRLEDQPFVKSQLTKFLKSVDPWERIAIYALGKRLRVLCDFTDGLEERQRILATFRGSTGPEVPGDTDPADTGNALSDQLIDEGNKTMADVGDVDRVRTTAAALSAIAGHVADLPGRKTLVWMTGSLPVSPEGAAAVFNRANLSVYPVDARALVGPPYELMASAPIRSYRSGPPVIPKHFGPKDLQTMQDLADLTGGRAFYNTNGLSGAVHAALDDSAVTYTLGFYPDPESLDGKFHELKVQVARGGLAVRYRRAYLALKEQPASEEQTKSNLVTALESPLESSIIPLSARIERRQGRLEIALSMDFHNLELARNGGMSNGAVKVFFVQKDGTGKVLESKAYALQFKREDYKIYLRTGIAFNKSVVLRDGAKTLRIVSVDPLNAAVGSLIIPLSQLK